MKEGWNVLNGHYFSRQDAENAKKESIFRSGLRSAADSL